MGFAALYPSYEILPSPAVLPDLFADHATDPRLLLGGARDRYIEKPDGSFEVLERVEGGKHQVSVCAGAPALLGWATGNLPAPPNNPQVGMLNMRTVMPALQKAKPVKLAGEGLAFASVSLPKQRRETRIVKDMAPDDIAREIVEWIQKD